MINKENEEKDVDKDKTPVDQTRVDVLAHVVITDKDTGTVLVDKRG